MFCIYFSGHIIYKGLESVEYLNLSSEPFLTIKIGSPGYLLNSYVRPCSSLAIHGFDNLNQMSYIFFVDAKRLRRRTC